MIFMLITAILMTAKKVKNKDWKNSQFKVAARETWMNHGSNRDFWVAPEDQVDQSKDHKVKQAKKTEKDIDLTENE